MDLKKLPPSMLVVLGLACNRTPTVVPCLSPPYDPSTEEPHPCLSPEEPPTEDPGTEDPGTEDPGPGDVGPCLSPVPDPAPNDSGTDTSGDADVGPCLMIPLSQADDAHELATTPAGSRRDAVDRVLARAMLPPDVAERLRRRSNRE